MQKYELTVVMPEKTTAAKKKAFQEGLEKTVKALEGKIVKTDDWGEKELAYKIAKSNSGNFTLYSLELNASKAPQLYTKMRVDNDVIRYLLVRSD